MDELCTSLNSKKSGHHVRIEKVFYSEIALESLVVKVVEVLLDTLRVARLSKRKVLVVCKLAEVLAHHIFKVIDHGGDRLYFVRIYLFSVRTCVTTRLVLQLLHILCCNWVLCCLKLFFLLLNEFFFLLNDI